MQLETGTIVDRYTVEGLLGQGGMAMVYRARHQQLGTLHALKVLLLPAQSIRDRLVQEGRVQARLRHPNIVNVTDLVEIDGAPGLVMEYIPGPSLDDLLRQCDLSIEQVDLIARGILDGVAAAHEVELVHRDLKPGNVLIEVRKDGLNPKITDFGLAKLVSDDGAAASKTRSGLAMGTPCYMAPEQIRNAKGVDARADVFSLGAVLYELITGQRAFDGDDTFEIFTAVTSGSFVPVRDLVPQTPQRMVDAIEAAMRTDLDERVQSVTELLRIWTDGTPAPDAAVAFAPAFLQRAEEMGSGADEMPMSWAPSDSQAKAPSKPSASTAVPPAPEGAATMDWSLGEGEKSEAPSLAPAPPPPSPIPQGQTSNRDPRIRRAVLGLGAMISVGLVGLVGVGLVGGGLLIRGTTVEVAVSGDPAEFDAIEARQQGGLSEGSAAKNDAVADAELEEDEADAAPSKQLVGRSTAPEPPPPADAIAEKKAEDPAPPEELVAVADVDGTGEEDLEADAAGPGEVEPEPEPEAGEAEPVGTGNVTVRAALHPMTKGATAIADVWLVDAAGKRHEVPGSVPAGSYRISVSFNNKDPQDVGQVTVAVGATVNLGCYSAIKDCRVE